MSKFIKVSICSGTSPGPFTIYYNSISPNTIANHFLPPPATAPYPPAVNLTLSDLTNIANFYIVEVPDSAYQIILVDSNNICNPVYQLIPIPTPTPTVTMTPTPTRTPSSISINVQFEIYTTHTDYVGLLIFNQRLYNGQTYPAQYIGTNLTLLPSSVVPDNDYLYGIRFPAANVDVIPVGVVETQQGVVSNTVNLPGRYTGPLNYSFCFFPMNTGNNFRYKAYIFQNGILAEVLDRTTYKNNPNGGVVYKETTNNTYIINNNDVIKIYITDML